MDLMVLGIDGGHDGGAVESRGRWSGNLDRERVHFPPMQTVVAVGSISTGMQIVAIVVGIVGRLQL